MQTTADGYKLDHRRQYFNGTNMVFSNLTPRNTRRASGDKKIVWFGLQYLVKKYLIKKWNKKFFSQPKEKVIAKFVRRINNYLGPNQIGTQHMEDLHDLGYLPIEIWALPEGSVVGLRVPPMVIFSTDDRFSWVTNYLETIISTTIWLPCTSATTARQYKMLLNKFADETVGNTDFVQWQGHDFSMRGMAGLEAAKMSGAGHLLSFTGTDTIPAIDFLEKYYNADCEKELIGGSVPACYDDQTEILTDKGFVLFSKLSENDKVAEFTKDKKINFVKPSHYYICPYEGEMIKFYKESRNYIDLVVTPNHKMVKEQNNSIELFEAGDFSYRNRSGYSSRNRVLVSGNTSTDNENELSELDKLRIAFQADGSFPSRKDSYTGDKTGMTPIRFSLKKQRKKDRLKSILDKLQFNYTENHTNEGKKDGYSSYWITSKETFQKDFNWIDLTKISNKWAAQFIEELKYWDGCNISGKNVFTYSSCEKICIDMIQAVAALCGYKTNCNIYIDKRGDRKPNYTLSIIRNKDWISGEGIRREKIHYKGFVYCVSVPSKMLIVRRNNVVSVCGNTEHASMCVATGAILKSLPDDLDESHPYFHYIAKNIL
jgi:hypothetical protein